MYIWSIFLCIDHYKKYRNFKPQLECCFYDKSIYSQRKTISFKGKDLLERIQLILNSDTFVYANCSILFQELSVAMVIKEFNILMLKSPLNQERYKILLMIYFLIYRNLLEFIMFVQSYFHYL